MRIKALGPDHVQVSYSLAMLAAAHSDAGDFSSAIDVQQRALRIRERVLGTDHPRIADLYFNMGANYMEIGDLR
jgi:hypothetical protein